MARIETTFPRETPATVGQSQFVQPTRCGRNLIAEVVVPSIGQREAPIIAMEVGSWIEELPRGRGYFILDMSAVTVISSIGLGMCLDLRHRAIEQGRQCVLYGLNRHLLDLFRMMKVDRMYKIVHGGAALRKLLDK